MIIVWFRRDLRIQDNPALQQALLDAAESGRAVEAVYLHSDEFYGDWPLGEASRWYLHYSLSSLGADLAKIGVPLQLFSVAKVSDLTDLAVRNGASAIYWNRVVEPLYESIDHQLLVTLGEVNIDAQSFDDDCLLMPEHVHKDDGTPYKVFTPFWRRALAQLEQQPQHLQRLSLPPNSAAAVPDRGSELLPSLGLLPENRWHQKLHDYWQPGEASALALLQTFLSEVAADYESGRDLPGQSGTSRLSAALHFGEISVVRAFHEARESLRQESDEIAITGIRRFMSELGWREFGRHVLSHFPQTTNHSLNHVFDEDSLWESDIDDERLLAWQRGETGIPLVDAGMRELWETGWMHNRVRMVVGSFLTKNLGIHWKHGARWFWDTLVDADLASNTMGWQWVSGCGTDAAPYFRIFNPHTQAKKFDPAGVYINRWLPSEQLIPEIIDLKLSRERALQRYQQTMSEARARAATANRPESNR